MNHRLAVRQAQRIITTTTTTTKQRRSCWWSSTSSLSWQQHRRTHRGNTDSSSSSSSSSRGRTTSKKKNIRFAKLQTPQILFQSNHILAVHKPPGWHSVPNLYDADTNKCLMTYLRQNRFGGGSQRDFLKPIHRLDQPCSGILLYGKTTKAASRIQSQWRQVLKTYHVVVQATSLQGQHVLQACKRLNNTTSSSVIQTWTTLKGVMSGQKRRQRFNNTNYYGHGSGWPVIMIPQINGHEGDDDDDGSSNGTSNNSNSNNNNRNGRLCKLDFQLKQQVSQYSLLKVHTHQGARHMVRALLSAHGLVIAGDLKYGHQHHHHHMVEILPDQSVALHASKLELPTTVQLGRNADDMTRTFTLPLPEAWKDYFGFDELEEQSDQDMLLSNYLNVP